MIEPGAPWTVMFFPAREIGLNVEEFVKSKVVEPAKVTTVPVLTLVKSIVLLVGAWIS